MATYFDHTVQAHKNLLPSDIRTDAELSNVAAIAEADVINEFTRAPGYTNYTSDEELLRDGIVSTEVVGEDITAEGAPSGAIVPTVKVYLRGYKVDADDPATDPNLKLALRRTIAEVIRWRFGQWRREQAVASASDGNSKSRSFRDGSDSSFPPDWDRWLKPFKSEEPLWSF